MKTYGIYLAYPPTVDLRAEGLGRYLAEFLKAVQERGDVRFAIACPSWMRASLVELFDASGVRADGFEIIAPRSLPVLLRMHQRYVAARNKLKAGSLLGSPLRSLGGRGAGVITRVARDLVGIRSLPLAGILGVIALPLAAIGAVWLIIAGLLASGRVLVLKFFSRLGRQPMIQNFRARIDTLAAQPKQDSLATRLYRLMDEAETSLMRSLIEARKDIAAWYSPTAFWPHFNDISAPRLMCVPDMVLGDFPVGFAALGGNRFLENFRQVERAIQGGEHYVSYSETVKWQTLVRRYQAAPEAVAVVPHGANRLDDLVRVSGFPDNEAATDALCRNLFRSALGKAIGQADAGIFGAGEPRFLFYASQFRPNKNVISLLRAYEYLLRRRYVGHKLVLTGNPAVLPEIGRFISDHHLENDVLCLHGLSARELAACYRLADLAVNPSLSEGGCPFTFTEALSVGTPVVMARIPVTEEVITDLGLQEAMLFDPYDWADMADRIEWGVRNREALREMQLPCYERLVERSWRMVVDEYVAILDRIAAAGAAR